MKPTGTRDADLPAGTLTFVFTDIEGSSVLWEDHPVEMRDALVVHDAHAESAIGANGGHIFKHTGDGLASVFAAAPAALAAAVDLQHRLRRESFPAIGQLRVRVGVHTGEAKPVDGDYFGPPVNRAAKLMDAGHGGQILVSGTCKLVVDQSAQPGPRLVALGLHELIPSATLERVFQVVEPGLPSEFAPLRTSGRPLTNLPAIASPFVGRAAELATVTELVASRRIVTLSGPGGMGKTRLAIEVGHRLTEIFTDGVWLIEFATVDDESMVADTVLEAIGLPRPRSAASLGTVVQFLVSKEALLVFDNCEHLPGSIADFVEEISRHCGRVHILATSRSTLAVSGESVHVVPGMQLPDPAAATPDQIAAESVEFFCERASAATNRFDRAAELDSIVEICLRLDGMPLALELAAARLRLFSAKAVADRLDDVFGMLEPGRRPATERHQTLESMMDWSFSLLDPWAQSLFMRASTFRGGFTPEALDAVASADGAGTLHSLDRLVEASLVTVVDDRCWMLEVVRQYASRRLDAIGELESFRDHHAGYFARLAQSGSRALDEEQAEARSWLEVFEAEHDNFRASLEWTVARESSSEALASASALSRFWYRVAELGWVEGLDRKRHREAEGWLIGLLQGTEHQPSGALLHIYAHMFYLAAWRGDTDDAEAYSQQATAVAEVLDDDRLVAIALNLRGSWSWVHGDYASAREAWQTCEQLLQPYGGVDYREALTSIAYTSAAAGRIDDALRYAEELDVYGRTHETDAPIYATATRGLCAYYRGDLERASVDLSRALSGFREHGIQPMVAMSLRGLAAVSFENLGLDVARDLAAESLSVARDSRYVYGELRSHLLLGQIAATTGNMSDARAHIVRGLALQPAGLDHSALMWASLAHATVASAEDRPFDAVKYHAVAATIRDARDIALPPTRTTAVTGALDGLAGRLGQEGFVVAWQGGANWPMADLNESMTRRSSWDHPVNRQPQSDAATSRAPVDR